MLKGSDFKSPYQKEDIDRIREEIKIGDEIWIEEEGVINITDKRMRKYRVVEKYKWFCILKNGRKQITKKWIDLLLEKSPQLA